MAKDKKNKDGGKKAKSAASRSKGLKAMADNPVVAEVVAAALVATASALRDSNKARRLASEAGDELNKLAREGAERGSALWEMALQIGKRSLDALTGDAPAKGKKPKRKDGKAATAKAKAKPKKSSGAKRSARAGAR